MIGLVLYTETLIIIFQIKLNKINIFKDYLTPTWLEGYIRSTKDKNSGRAFSWLEDIPDLSARWFLWCPVGKVTRRAVSPSPIAVRRDPVVTNP